MSKAKQAGEKRGGGQDVIKGPSTNRNATQNQQAPASLDIYLLNNPVLHLCVDIGQIRKKPKVENKRTFQFLSKSSDSRYEGPCPSPRKLNPL